MSKRKAKRKGGRRPGSWTLLTQEALKEFRKGAKLSRTRLSGLLGVSRTSVQNWETGRSVPLTRYQEQIVSLMQGGADAAHARPPGSKGAIRTRGAAPRGGAHSETSLAVTGEILKSYLATPKGSQVTREQLVDLAVALRAALS